MNWNLSAPLLEDLQALRETCWRNPGLLPAAAGLAACHLTMADVEDAAARLHRFAPFFASAFPETAPAGGLIESPVQPIPAMAQQLGIRHPLWVKLDSHLPVSGSIKARGGVYEVLKTAEEIALREGILHPGDDYRCFDTPAFRQVLSGYSMAVGSTGNLGLSIGIMSARLGFHVTVHMSADARQWKKDLLRSKGVHVIEYASDYSEAVKQGRTQAKDDPRCHFVDDENSQTLFLGYAVAALRLRQQLAQAGVTVDEAHPLLVYLPCGVGGGPGGVAFGLKLVYGDAVRCFFAEPTHAPCMLLGMASGLHNNVAVTDLGIDPRTAADGLAVGRASGFVGKVMEPLLSGCYTVTDERMFRMLTQLAELEQLRLEPSALAGMYGPVMTEQAAVFRGLASDGCTHLVWATGGSMVPQAEWKQYDQTGKDLLRKERETT